MSGKCVMVNNTELGGLAVIVLRINLGTMFPNLGTWSFGEDLFFEKPRPPFGKQGPFLYKENCSFHVSFSTIREQGSSLGIQGLPFDSQKQHDFICFF